MVATQVASLAQSDLATSKRYFISEASDEHRYVLPADEVERERLNNQSQFIIQAYDHQLIWAPVDLKDGDIVVDSGTGSGHWLLSLAKERDEHHKIPSINLRGIDISPRMFPTPPLIPVNTSFSTDSITSLPASWTNTVSLVHQRMLMVALQAPQWKAALSEMYRVLKPGGWIQIFEGHYLFDSPSEAVVHHKAFQLRDTLCWKYRDVVYDITDRLQEWIEQAGFVNVKIEKRGLPMGATWADEASIPGIRGVEGFWKALKEPVMKEGGIGIVQSGEEYDAVIGDLKRLCEENPGTCWPIWLFTAKKPEA